MNVLVTGAAGFIGSHIAERLEDRGDHVTGIDNLSTGLRDNFPEPHRLIVGDIAERRMLEYAFAASAPEVVFHCAASYKDPSAWELDARTNVRGTIEVLRLAATYDVRRIVYFQTSLCYGLNPASPVTLEHPLDPTSSYAITKTAAEQFIRLSGLDYVSLRLANIYGPRNLSGPPPAFYRRLAAEQPCTVVDTSRDFVFVDDLVDFAVRMADERRGGIWHVASGRTRTILKVYEAVADAMGLELPAPRVTPHGADDAATILIDPSRTEQAFGWRASTPFDEGIARAVAWYDEHGVANTYTHLELKG